MIGSQTGEPDHETQSGYGDMGAFPFLCRNL